MSDALPSRVTIVEVGPRDGLQNEPGEVPTATKVELVERLAATGIGTVEATSFVSPRAVPQLADAGEVMRSIVRRPGTGYPVLVPNLRGYEAARDAGATDIAVFTAASEGFNRKNVGASIAESLERFRPVVDAARADDVRVRAYVSTAFGCPFDGEVAPEAVHEVAARIVDLGVGDLSIGDTIGVAVPTQVEPVCAPLLAMDGVERVALHLHDTRGTALANAWAGLQVGIDTFDTSVGGLGGCPFAPGASGNLATEDLVWMLYRCGIETGVDLDALREVAAWITATLGRTPAGHVATAPPWPPVRP